MKFSVLLPTRDRLELLKYAIESVVRQGYPDWEVIVSDNYSEQDVAGYVRSLNDARIKYFRTDAFVPVTENWNNALEKSTGDYVVMLGDDDCLLRDYFQTLYQLIASRGHPDLVYHSALLYAYPGAMPGYPDGFLQAYGYADFLKNAKQPFWLDRAAALRSVRKSMNFMVSFGFNMQFALVSRRLVGTLREKGAFFQSPYPDYYAMNALFLKAESILVCPQPLVTIGMSPKSFGFYYFNRSESSGVEFLRNSLGQDALRRLKDALLPGTDMNDSWLAAMETLRVNYGSEFGLEVNCDRYRLLQIFQACIAGRDGSGSSRATLTDIWQRLRFGEKLVAASLWAMVKVSGLLPYRLRQIATAGLTALLGIHPLYRPKRITGRYRNILEVYESLDPLPEKAPS